MFQLPTYATKYDNMTYTTKNLVGHKLIINLSLPHKELVRQNK